MQITEQDKKQRQDFIDIFKEVEVFLREEAWVPNAIWFWEILRNILRNRSKSAYIISQYKDEFNLFVERRNSYSHQNWQNYIPSEWAIEIFKKIRDKIIKPKTIYEFVKETNNMVFSCEKKDKLKDVLSIMQEKTYTHVPVISDWEFVWLLSESSICERLNNNIDQDWSIIIDDAIVADVNLNPRNDNYIIDKRNTPLHVVLETFDDYIDKWERLWAIFITNLWKRNEELDWVITAWDIPSVKNFYNL